VPYLYDKEAVMNTAILVALGLVIYGLMYLTYGRTLSRSLVKASDQTPTPAHRMNDGVDYVPGNKWVLFGHHFASIAGAAPIVGPAIAMAWGWMPALLWIWLGNVFIGAVHDYLSLMSSVRHDGKSVQWIAGRIMQKRTGYLFSWFVQATLILLMAAFMAIIGNMFVKQPAVPSASFFFIVAAVVFGVILYRMKVNFHLSTAIGLVMMAGAIWLGVQFPMTMSYEGWLVALFVYIVAASALPVWILLQPRDYLNAWILWLGLAIGGVAYLLAAQPVVTPAFTAFSAPVIAGKPSPFWPLIPLIIACGSLSGFHALVASGTTSKQLDKESDGLLIGYGGMFTEGFLSTLVVAGIGAFGLQALGVEAARALATPETFAAGYGKAIGAVGGPLGIASTAYALGVNAGLGLPVAIMTVFAAMWVTAFSLTTLDTGARLARFTLAEIAEPIKDSMPGFHGVLVNRWIGSLIPAVLGLWLAWGGAWSAIWPAFGGANQLLASVALLTASVWVSRTLQASAGYRLLVMVPAMFLWVTVTLALGWYLVMAVPTLKTHGVLMGAITVLMIVLNVYLLVDYLRAMRRREEPAVAAIAA
jgi:carbon starvation protein